MQSGKYSGAGRVQVYCRVRPFNAAETQRGARSCLRFSSDPTRVQLCQADGSAPAAGTNSFSFNRVFDLDSTQHEVYDVAARPIIDSVVDGFNGTVFAYGQTSSGKTYTMQGPDINDIDKQGIVPRMVRTIFSRIESASSDIEFSVQVSMAEIYKEKIKDLLDPRRDNLEVREDKLLGVYIKDITEQFCVSEHEVYDLMAIGNKHRKVASNNINDQSSRSHALFSLTLTMKNTRDGSCKRGKLHLVDLAGSEKTSKTGAVGNLLDEAKSINLSLTTLGRVIVALTDRNVHHIPYRESKLTRILSESLGGNSKTCMIVTVSPHPCNEQETLGTLRYGARAQNITNVAKVNKEYSVAELKLLLEKAEGRVRSLEDRVRILRQVIVDLGGTPPSDKEAEALALQIEA